MSGASLTTEITELIQSNTDKYNCVPEFELSVICGKKGSEYFKEK
jgi:hypothetical protein